jgi:hypothetical protein
MLTKTPEAEQPATDWPVVFLDFEETIKPFVQWLAENSGLQGSEREALIEDLLNGFDDWFFHLFARKAADVLVPLLRARHHATALQKELRELDSTLGFLRADVVGSEFENLVKMLDTERWLKNYSKANHGRYTFSFRSKRHFDDIVESMCKVERAFDEAFEASTVDVRSRRGRPRGSRRIREYPELHRLIFHLGYSAAWAELRFPAYVKQNGETRVAAGALINTLDSLREYLMQDPPELRWLAEFLPLPDQHQRHISTYRRLVEIAWARVEWEDPAISEHSSS